MADNDNNSMQTRARKLSEIGRNITMVGQLGLSLIMPLLLCMAACYLLNTKAGIGGWVYIPGFVLGLGSSATTAWKAWQSVLTHDQKEKKDRGPSFNRHL